MSENSINEHDNETDGRHPYRCTYAINEETIETFVFYSGDLETAVNEALQTVYENTQNSEHPIAFSILRQNSDS
ncbi:hypothetical protein [Paenibacillus sp. NPDC058071]|uniref:hypothetical protein n=1 Tax=Paenibacillus sp. NPDC058071 TaxID=3346326 RepID=UPI0036DBAB60